MGFLDWLGGNADPYRVVGADGKPVNQLPQSSFNATPMGGMVNNDYSGALGSGMAGAQQGLQNAQNNYGQQQDFINLLQGQAMGQGPSVAQELLRQQTQQNNQNAASAIGSQRGMNPGLAQKLILDQQANQNQQSVGQGSLLRAQEMMSARGMLGSALGQQAGTAFGQAGAGTGLMGQAGGLQLGQQGQQLGNYWNAQNINSQTAMGNAQLGLGAEQINAGAGAANAQNNPFGAILGGFVGGAGMAATMGAKKAAGGEIPGHAQVRGDSTANDHVPALLSPHEIVLPRSVTLADDAPERARDFVRAIKGRLPKKKEGVLKAAGGVDVPDPATDPGAFGPSSTTEAYFGGHTSMTDPQQAGPAAADATQPPEMLAAPPPDSIAAPSAPQFEGPGTLAGRGPSLDFPQPKEKPFTPGAEMLGGEKEELAGIKGEAGAKKALGSSLKESAGQLQKDLAGVNSKYDAQIQAAQGGATAAQAWLNDPNNKANPDRYWAEKTTGQKITASIGMILGGIGAGLTHGPNYAAEMITKSIDRDVEAQKLNIGVKENALTNYLKQGMTLEAAKEHAKADARDMAAARLDSASAAYLGTAAQAQAQIESGKLKQDAYMHRLQGIAMARQNEMSALQQKWMLERMSQPGGMAKAMLEMSFWQHPEKMAEHTVGVDEDVPTGAKDSTGKPVMQTKTTPYLANSPEARKTVSETMGHYRSMDSALKDLEGFSKKNPLGGTPGSEEVGEAEAAAMHLKMNYESTMAGMNRQASPEVLKHIDEIVSDPTALFKTSKTGGKLKFLRRMLNELKQNSLDTNTLGPQ